MLRLLRFREGSPSGASEVRRSLERNAVIAGVRGPIMVLLRVHSLGSHLWSPGRVVGGLTVIRAN